MRLHDGLHPRKKKKPLIGTFKVVGKNKVFAADLILRNFAIHRKSSLYENVKTSMNQVFWHWISLWGSRETKFHHYVLWRTCHLCNNQESTDKSLINFI